MRIIVYLLVVVMSLPALTHAAAPAGATQQKLKVVIHDTPRCIVTRSNIALGRPKFELVYIEGDIEHHIYVANRAAAQTFFKNPQVYMDRLRQMESQK